MLQDAAGDEIPHSEDDMMIFVQVTAVEGSYVYLSILFYKLSCSSKYLVLYLT